MSDLKSWWVRNASSVDVALFLVLVASMALLVLMVLVLPMALPV